MNWGMEVLNPTSYMRNSSLFHESKRGAEWTLEENKQFETALALYDKDTEDRWIRIAGMIPGKTEIDVIKHYESLVEDVNDIEAGLIPIPGYSNSSFTLDWESKTEFDGFKQPYGGKRLTGRPDHERKKGIPWTEEEHRLFLKGLKKYGKGDWRNISRNFVVSKTPTQVASHAQKYFIRLNSGGKDKRRSSIHDITTVSLNDNGPSSPTHSSSSSTNAIKSTEQILPNSINFKWNQIEGASQSHKNTTIVSLYGTNPYQTKYEGANLQRSNVGTSLEMVFPP